MKKLISFLVIAISAHVSVQAKIWRVNNNPGINANFTTAQAAHDGAANGDTLMFESSLVSYGDLTLTKKLVVLGLGYFLPEYSGKQATTINARLGAIMFEDIFNSSNVLTSSSNGSVMSGIEATGAIITHVSNININRCKVQGISIMDGTGGGGNGLFSTANIVFYQNYVEGGIGVSTSSSVSNTTVTNVIIKNNILNSSVNIYDFCSGIVENNTFRLANINSMTLVNSTFRSNILSNNNTPVGFAGKNSTIANNVFSNTFSSASGAIGHTYTSNLSNVNMNNVFVTDPVPATPATGFTSDNRFVLKTGSPAIGTGFNGVDAGAFGSATPYVLAGIPAIPSIYLLEVPTSGQNTLNVKMSIRSNQ